MPNCVASLTFFLNDFSSSLNHSSSWEPKFEVLNTDTMYCIRAEIPGMSKKDIDFKGIGFYLLDRNIKFHIKKKEGSKVNKGSIIAVIEGEIKNILIQNLMVE